MPSNHLILCCPLLLLLSMFPSIRVFSNLSVLCIRWPKCWSFSFSISPSNEYSGLISFRMDWWDLLAVQGTLKSLLQHHRSKASILQCSAFFIVQLTSIYDYWKNHNFDKMDLCWQSNVSAFFFRYLKYNFILILNKKEWKRQWQTRSHLSILSCDYSSLIFETQGGNNCVPNHLNIQVQKMKVFFFKLPHSLQSPSISFSIQRLSTCSA